MSFASQFHIPGAYHFDASSTSGPALSAGIFRPPMSPSASSSVLNLAKSTGSLYSDSSAATPVLNAKRKRVYDETGRESTPLAEWTSMNADAAYNMAENVETPADRSSARAMRYTLAGQIETPDGAAGNPLENMEDSVYSDVDYRRALGPKQAHAEVEPSGGFTTSPGDRWSVLGTLGGMVGKVWEFCKAGAFRGFYAGGGAGYDLKPLSAEDQHGAAIGTPWPKDPDAGNALRSGVSAAPHGDGFPGVFPESDYIPYRADHFETTTPDTPPRPPAKRRQVSAVGDELGRNWVIVEPGEQGQARRAPVGSAPAYHPARPSSRLQQRPAGPNRRISIPVSRLGGTPHLGRRPSSRTSFAGSPSLSAREPASFAQPRSPVSPSRPPSSMASRIPVAAHPPSPFARVGSPRPSSRQSAITSPTAPPFPSTTTGGSRGHRRSQSAASAASTSRRKTGLGADDIVASPRLDAEAKHLATRKLAVEKDTDARMEAFSARLREMIRQGKEALGTTVEVDVLGVHDVQGEQDGAWMDDDD